MPLYTRSEFRDRIRRRLQIVPPIDIPLLGALPGQQPTNYPRPTNAEINDCFNDAVSDINQECGFHVSQFDVPVEAADSSTYGPYGIDLSDLTPTTSTTALVSPTGRIVNVLRVLWTPDSGGVPQLLVGANRNYLDRGQVSNYYANLPSSPQNWYVEQYTLWILPAQSETGTYTITSGDGIVGLGTDGATLDQVPIDFQTVFEDQCIVRLSMADALDVEAAQRARFYAPSAMAGMRRFKAWKEGGTGVVNTGLAFTGNYRSGYGTRRTVR